MAVPLANVRAAYSRWDLLPGGRAAAVPALLARTGPFERWLASPNRDGPRELAALSLEYWRRRSHWEARLACPPERDDPIPWAVAIIAGIAALTGAAAMAASFWPASVALILLAAGIVAGAHAALRRERTLPRALDRRRCPDCWYDLSATTVVPPPLLDGAFLGPERCPECGVPWPLIPPSHPPPLTPDEPVR